MRVGEAHGRLGLAHADVHVQAERRLAPRQLPHRAVHRLVPVPAGHDRLVPDREGVGACARDLEAEQRQLSLELRPQRVQLGRGRADRLVHARGQLERGLVRLRGHVTGQLRVERIEHAVDLLRQRPVVGMEEHHLLLDADRVARARRVRRPGAPVARRRSCRPLGRALRERARGRGRAPRRAPRAGPRPARHSACHWTPSMKGRPGASTASTTPSGDRADTRRPAPRSATAWWWNELTLDSSCRSARRAGCRPRSRTAWVAIAAGRTAGAGATRRDASGRCWTSVPPRATLSAWVPRQIASNGIPISHALPAAASSKLSTCGSVGPSSGCGRRRRTPAPGRGRRTGRCRRGLSSSGRHRTGISAGSTTGRPPAASMALHVFESQRQLVWPARPGASA